MTNHPDSYPLSDVCLLLRAHAEQGWLSHELVPVLRQLEQRDHLPEEQLGAAMAYLEVLWLEASQRAAETEAAFAELDSVHISPNPSLWSEARDYHHAVSALRRSVERNVARILARSAPSVAGCGPARNGGPVTRLDASF